MSQFLKPVPASSPPKSRNTISPNTQSKSPYYNDLQQGSTLQKSQQSLRNSHYISKFEKSIDMDMKQSNTFNNPEFEIKKLMNLVELQQHEINNWKRRYEQAETRCISSYQTQTMLEYEKHLDQLTKELKNSIQQNDEFSNKLREKDTQLLRLNKQIDIQKQQLDDYSSELKYLQHEKVNLDKDASMQLYQKDQKYNQNLQEMQQAHFEQLQLMDDQIQKLQDELVRRNQANEFQKQEIVQLDKIVNEIKTGEKNLMQQLESLKVKYQDLQEEKKREVNKLIQQNEQQVKSKEKEFQDEKDSLVDRIGQLQYENNILNQQVLEQQSNQLKLQIDLIQGLQDEIQSQVEQNCNLQEQNHLSTQDLDQKYRKSVSEIKMEYQQQINKLLQEIQKVNQQLDQTQNQLQQNQQLNQELQIGLENLNQHHQSTTSQLKQVQNDYDSLQLQYDNDIQEQNQDIEQLNDQVNQLSELLEQRSNEFDECRQQKGQLALRNNENNLLIQRLQVELECQKQKLIEIQKQQEVSEQVKDEIKRSQIEQIKRQMESQVEILESENRTLRYQIEMKNRECEEWKQQYTRNQ